MVYYYQNTIIAVMPGLGVDNWATCKRLPNGGWTTVKTKEMPRTKNIREAEENLVKWAEKKKLKRADCDICDYLMETMCLKHNEVLEEKRISVRKKIILRCKQCLCS